MKIPYQQLYITILINMIYLTTSIQVVSQTAPVPVSKSEHLIVNRFPLKTLPKDATNRLQKKLDEIVAKDGVGASIGIILPQGAWFGSSGFANTSKNIPVKISDKFRIGSITKPFIATVILQLAQEGKLSLDDTLDRWLSPEVLVNIPDSEQITIRQILNGSAGLYDYVSDLMSDMEKDNSLAQKQWTPTEIIHTYLKNKPRSKSWVYPNTGYILAGMIIEKATGRKISQEVRQRIIQPLRMRSTFFPEEEKIPGGIVRGYEDIDRDKIKDDVTDINVSFAWTAGAIVSNTYDMTRFFQGLFTGKLLKDEYLQQMLTFVDARNKFQYGLGIVKIETSFGILYGHDGGIPGFESLALYSPERKSIFVSLQNSSPSANTLEILDVLGSFEPSI